MSTEAVSNGPTEKNRSLRRKPIFRIVTWKSLESLTSTDNSVCPRSLVVPRATTSFTPRVTTTSADGITLPLESFAVTRIAARGDERVCAPARAARPTSAKDANRVDQAIASTDASCESVSDDFGQIVGSTLTECKRIRVIRAYGINRT